MTRYQTRPYFSSSRSWASTMAQGGIFDTAGNSAFGNANRVYVKYCSSDLWAGALPASQANPGGFAFMGSRIVSGVISALVANHGLGAGHRLLFGGCSAGAIGAMHNLDAVSTQLASTGVEVKGLLDAAALVDIYPSGWAWSPDLLPLQTLVAELVALLKPTFPAVCAERGYTGENEWRCLFSAYRLPLLTTPFLRTPSSLTISRSSMRPTIWDPATSNSSTLWSPSNQPILTSLHHCRLAAAYTAPPVLSTVSPARIRTSSSL